MKTPDPSIIEKTLNNEARFDEAREVIRWFKTPEGQSWLSERMDADERGIHEGDEENWIDRPIPSVVMYEGIMRQLHRQRIRRWIACVAAVLIPVAVFIGLFMRVSTQVDLMADGGYDEVCVPHGERMQVIFQDGSKVHLNAGSRLRYPKKFGLKERKIQLDGEAWFEVARNTNRPFIVDLTCVDIRVLGTTFDVKAYPDEGTISVALETGAIELESQTSGTYQLLPGEKAVYDKASGRCEVARSRDVSQYSAWRRNVLVFKGASLSDVMTTLSRNYNISFNLKDSVALKYTYTLTTDSTSLATVLKELEKITPVRFEEKESGIVVTMKK